MSIIVPRYSRYFERVESELRSPDSILACTWKTAAEIGENACRKARLKKVRAQPIWMRHRPRVFVVPGAMVDIGLGPTNGILVICAFRSGSPRRVQTDAYHRPRILNYVPCHITSFFRFPPSGSSIFSTTASACQRVFRNRKGSELVGFPHWPSRPCRGPRNLLSWSVAAPLELPAPGEGRNPRFGRQTGPADMEWLLASFRLLWGHWCGAIMCRGEPDRVVIC